MSSLAAAAAAGREAGNRRPVTRSRKNVVATPTKMPVCSFFARGECRRGSACRFLHELDDSPSISSASRKKPPIPSRTKRNDNAPICSFFARGYCRRGDSCSFRHELPNEGGKEERDTCSTASSKQSSKAKGQDPKYSPKPETAESSKWLPDKRWFYGESGWHYGKSQPPQGREQEQPQKQQTRPTSSLAAAAARGRGESTIASNAPRSVSSNRKSEDNVVAAPLVQSEKTEPPTTREHGEASTNLTTQTMPKGDAKEDSIPNRSSSEHQPHSPSDSSREHSPKPILSKEPLANEKNEKRAFPLQPLTIQTHNTNDHAEEQRPSQNDSPACKKSTTLATTNDVEDANVNQSTPAHKGSSVPESSRKPCSESSEPLQTQETPSSVLDQGTGMAKIQQTQEKIEETSRTKNGAEETQLDILPSMAKLKIDTECVENKGISIRTRGIEDVSPLPVGVDSPAVTTTTPLRSGKSRPIQTPKTTVSAPGQSSLAKAAAAGKAQAPRGSSHTKGSKQLPRTPSENRGNKNVPYWERLYQDGEKTKQKKLLKQQEIDAECTFSPDLSLSTPVGKASTQSWHRRSRRPGNRQHNKTCGGKGGGGGSRVPRTIGGKGGGHRADRNANRGDEASVVSEITVESYANTHMRRTGSSSSLPMSARGGGSIRSYPKKNISSRNPDALSRISGSPSRVSSPSTNTAGKRTPPNKNRARKAGSASVVSSGPSSVSDVGTDCRSLQNRRQRQVNRTNRIPRNSTSQVVNGRSEKNPSQKGKSRIYQSKNKSYVTSSQRTASKKNAAQSDKNTVVKGQDTSDIYGNRSVRALAARFSTTKMGSPGTCGKAPGSYGSAKKDMDVPSPDGVVSRGASTPKEPKKWVRASRPRWGDDSDEDD